MKLQTISQISKDFNLSTRTLRYYEQVGLIKSEKVEDYAYRVYSEDTVRRLKQIIILRKLRIPLKQIAFILQCENISEIIDALRQNLADVDDEVTALSTIRDIIAGFISRLNESIYENGAKIKFNLMDDTALLEAVDELAIQRIPLKEEKKEEKTAEDLQKADESLNKRSGKDIRIVYLPSMTVASIHALGQEGKSAENVGGDILDKFISDTNLKTIYPSARHFGFCNPDGVPDEDPAHGYEHWISIPDDMEVPAPLVKKHLEGGIYAAHMIPMGGWDNGWMTLHEWVAGSSTFEFRWGTVEGLCGWLEEHLNYWDWYKNYGEKVNQFDLLLPIRPRAAEETNNPQ